MVRIRHSDSVKIQLSGPRRVIPHTRLEIGRRSMTWKHFVTDICGIKLDSKVDYFICTAGYSPNHSVEGWTANLNDPIDQFVRNYTKKLKKYSVRLHRGRAPQKDPSQSPPPIPAVPTQPSQLTEIISQQNNEQGNLVERNDVAVKEEEEDTAMMDLLELENGDHKNKDGDIKSVNCCGASEMQDLLTRFEQSIDKFGKSLLEQI